MLKCGFEPVFDKNSKVLILGSFPSVKSRQIEFYYGNKQNRFWRTVCGFFGEAAPETVSDKIDFLLRRKIALWDIVTECEIVGSRDDTIKNFKVADLKKVLQKSQISFIIINGGKAYDIFLRSYPNLEIPHKKLCSTSPANTRYNESEWRDVLSGIFG